MPDFLHHDPCIIPVDVSNNVENLQPCNDEENEQTSPGSIPWSGSALTVIGVYSGPAPIRLIWPMMSMYCGA